MRIFLSHRFSGEDLEHLSRTLEPICNHLSTAGHSVYCSLFDPLSQSTNSDANYDYCLEKLQNHEVVLAFISSSHVSKGVEMEVEFAQKKGKRIFLAIHKEANYPKIRQVADQVIEFHHTDQLLENLRVLN